MFPFPFSFFLDSAGSTIAQIDNVYSMAFDGTSDFISLGTGVGNTLGSSITKMSISSWLKTRTSGGLPTNEGVFSFGPGPTSTATNPPFEIIQDNYNILYVRFGVNRVGFSFNVIPEAWRHYCLVYDGTKANSQDRLELYINGAATTKVNFFGTIPTSVDFTNTSSFIGGVNPSRYYRGSIDELAVFDYALTQEEAQSIYNTTTTGKTADLNDLTTPPIKWYRMGD